MEVSLMLKKQKYPVKKSSSKLEIINQCLSEIKESTDNPRKLRKKIQWLYHVTQTESLNAIQLVHLLFSLSKIEFIWWFDEQEYTEALKQLLNECLATCEKQLAQYKGNALPSKQDLRDPKFTFRELIILLNSVVAIPVNWQDKTNRSLLNILLLTLRYTVSQELEHTNVDDEAEAETASQDLLPVRNLANMVYALSQLPFSVKKHEELIDCLLNIMKVYYLKMGSLAINQCWQWLAVLHAREYPFDEQIKTMFAYFNSNLLVSSAATVSSAQKIITKKIIKWLSDDALEDLVIEHAVGVYTLDLAFIRHRINIEIDGEHHLAFGKLRFSDQVRDFVLDKVKNFIVVRISVLEFMQLKSKQQERFLQKKLESVQNLLRSARTIRSLKQLCLRTCIEQLAVQGALSYHHDNQAIRLARDGLLQADGSLNATKAFFDLERLHKKVNFLYDANEAFSPCSFAVFEKRAENQIKELFSQRAKNDLNSTTLANTLNKDLETVFHSHEKFLLELLQNADDAGSRDSFLDLHFQSKSHYLLFSHNGKPFDWNDVQAICDNAQQQLGNKRHDMEKTGYKGIGFKSVFVIADCVYIISNEYCFRFDKHFLMWQDGETEKRCYPWQIIPIWTERVALPSFVLDEGKVHFLFRLKEGVNLENILDTLRLNPIVLLFLRRVRTVNMNIKGKVHTIQMRRLNAIRYIDINGIKTQWLLFEKRIHLPHDIRMKLEAMGRHECPEKLKHAIGTSLTFAVKLSKEQGITQGHSQLFCYLPTDVDCGLSYSVNADFLLSADRMQLLKNDWNDFLMQAMGYYHVVWLADIARDPHYAHQTLTLLTFKLSPGVDKRFAQSYEMGVKAALADIHFIPSARVANKLMKFDEAIVDSTEFFKVFRDFELPLEEKLARYELKARDKLPKLFEVKEFSQRLEAYARESMRQRLYPKFIHFVISLSKYKKSSSLLGYYPNNPMFDVLNKAFLLTQKGEWVSPSQMCLPKNNANLVYPHFLSIHFPHSMLLEIAGAADWLRLLGVKEMSDRILFDALRSFFKRSQAAIAQNNAQATALSFEIVSCLGKLNLDEIKKEVSDSFGDLLLLTSQKQLRQARHCYLPTAFQPEMDLQTEGFEDDIFVSTAYLAALSDLKKLKSVLSALGVGSNVTLKHTTVTESSDTTMIHYYGEYITYLKTNDKVDFFGARHRLEKISYFNHMVLLSYQSYAAIFWEKLLIHHKELIKSIEEFGVTVASLRYEKTWKATSYLVFMLSQFPCVLASDNQLHKVSEVYSPVLIEQLGKRLVKHLLHARIGLQQEDARFSKKFVSLLGFKEVLSINDYIDLLTIAGNDEKKYRHDNFKRLYQLLARDDKKATNDYTLWQSKNIPLLASDDTLAFSHQLYCLPQEIFIEPLRSRRFIKAFPELTCHELQAIYRIFSIQSIALNDLDVRCRGEENALAIKEEMITLFKMGAILESCQTHQDKWELFAEWSTKLTSIDFIGTEDLIIQFKENGQIICQPRLFFAGKQLYYQRNDVRFKESLLKVMGKAMKISEPTIQKLINFMMYPADEWVAILREEGYDVHALEQFEDNEFLDNRHMSPSSSSHHERRDCLSIPAIYESVHSLLPLKKEKINTKADVEAKDVAIESVRLMKQGASKTVLEGGLKMTEQEKETHVVDAPEASQAKCSKSTKRTDYQAIKMDSASAVENHWSGRWGEEIVFYKLKAHYTKKYRDCVVKETAKGFTLTQNDNAHKPFELDVIWHNKMEESGNSVDFEVIKNNVKRFIEVKSTYQSDNMMLRMTKNEWALMRTHGDRYRFFCVYNAGNQDDVKIIKLKNPWKQLVTGDITPQETMFKLKSQNVT